MQQKKGMSYPEDSSKARRLQGGAVGIRHLPIPEPILRRKKRIRKIWKKKKRRKEGEWSDTIVGKLEKKEGRKPTAKKLSSSVNSTATYGKKNKNIGTKE